MLKWELQLPVSGSCEDIHFQHGESGIVYGHKYHVHDAIVRHEWKGQAWKYHNALTTYRPNGDIRYKSLGSLKPESEEDFWHIIESCRKSRVGAPSSFASIFQKVCPVPRPLLSELYLLHRESYGGWQENFITGPCPGKVYHYDIRSAYRWAACQGLPDPRSVYPVRSIDDSWSVFYGTVHNPPLYATSNRQLWTREEIEKGQLRIDEFIMGYGYADWIDFSPVFAEIDVRFPYCFKRISRAFWGRWNTMQPLEQVSWKHGKPVVSRRDNFAFNPIWSKIITARVKMRLLEIVQSRSRAVHVFVDSVLCYEPLPTGEGVGDWVLKGEYDGVRIWGPGIWGVGDRLVKHCGMKDDGEKKLTFTRQ